MGYSVGRKLTKEFVTEIAKQYSSKVEFQKYDSSAYKKAREQGYLEEICGHMIKLNYSIPQLICQQIFDSILKCDGDYNTRKIIKPYELDIYYHKYRLAIEYNGKGWHNDQESKNRDSIKIDLCEQNNIHLIIIQENNRNYEKDIKNQILNYIDKINSITNLNIIEKDIKTICIDYDKIFNFCKIELEIQNKIDKCKNITEFKQSYPKLYSVLLRCNLHHLLNPIRKLKIWTKELALQEALKIDNYSEFVKNSGLYLYCYKNDLINEATKHMIMAKHRIYSTEEIISIGKQYKTKYQFKKYQSGAFCAAKRLNLLESIFSGKENEPI